MPLETESTARNGDTSSEISGDNTEKSKSGGPAKEKRLLWWGFAAAALVSAIALAIGFVDWNPFVLHTPEHTWWWVALVLPLMLLIVIVIALVVRRRRPHDDVVRRENGWNPKRESASLGATLLGKSPIILGLAATVTVGLYVLPEEDYTFLHGQGEYLVLLVGIGVALAFGVGVSYFGSGYAAPNNINPDIYGALSSEFHDLNAQLEAYCPVIPEDPDAPLQGSQDAQGAACMLPHLAACVAARLHRDFIASELGLQKSLTIDDQSNSKTSSSTGTRWVLGTGYIDIWHRLHAVDEALFLVKPDAAVAGDGLYDVMRLKDSSIKNSVDHIGRLRQAVTVFGASVYLSTPPAVPQKVDVKDEDKAQARVVMQQVRHVINQYRDDRREGLVRTRNDLLFTGTLTGVISFLLLGLVILRQVEDSTLAAAMVFYLVGAIAGLFKQLSSGWGDAGATEEDYGLNQTRLLFTPLLSGLAAVGGVLVTSMLYASLSGPVVTTENVNIAVPQLSVIFDLKEDRFGLVIAAIFGLTPSILVDRLKGEADKYKADLQSSNAQGNT